MAGGRRLIEILVRGGADTAQTDNIDDTALHVAAYWGNVDAVRVLLGWGSSPYRKNVYGHEPLDVAVMSNRSATAEVIGQYMGQQPKANVVLDRTEEYFGNWEGHEDDAELERMAAGRTWDEELLYKAAGGKEALEKKAGEFRNHFMKTQGAQDFTW